MIWLRKIQGVDPEFFAIQIANLRKQIIDNAIGSSQKALTIVVLKRQLIPIPPTKAEQTAIATALSDMDALIEAQGKLIAKKRAIKQGAMQELLKPKEGWEVKRLGEVATINMGQSPLSEFYNTEGIGLPLIQGNADIENRKTIIRFYTSSITKTGKKGEIIMSVRAPVGEISKADFDCCLGRGVCSIAFHNDFLYHYLIFKEKTWSKYSSGSTFDSVNSKQVKDLSISIPNSNDEQTRIARILSDMDAEIEQLEAQLAKYRQVKVGMMQELLTGRKRLVQPSSREERISIAKEKPVKKKHNWQINEAVIIGVLAKEFGSEAYPIGRKRYTKLNYLLHRFVEKRAEGFAKYAAGPYNPSIRYKGPEKIALNNNYVKEVHNGKYRGFAAADNISQAERYFNNWYGQDALEWLSQFRYEKTDTLELWTTVDMAVEDLKKSGRPVTWQTVKQLIENTKEWRPKLKRPIFSDENIQEAIHKSTELFGS